MVMVAALVPTNLPGSSMKQKHVGTVAECCVACWSGCLSDEARFARCPDCLVDHKEDVLAGVIGVMRVVSPRKRTASAMKATYRLVASTPSDPSVMGRHSPMPRQGPRKWMSSRATRLHVPPATAYRAQAPAPLITRVQHHRTAA